MNYLLDTHISLWAILNHPKLSDAAKDIISEPDNTLYYSSISIWEVLLKNDSSKNSLSLSPKDYVAYCEGAGFINLTLKPKHIITANELHINSSEKKHKDPFDRMLIAQAKSENMYLLTHNSMLSLYNEKCIVSV